MFKLTFVSLSGSKFFIQNSCLIDMWIKKYIMKILLFWKLQKKLKIIKCCVTILPICQSM